LLKSQTITFFLREPKVGPHAGTIRMLSPISKIEHYFHSHGSTCRNGRAIPNDMQPNFQVKGGSPCRNNRHSVTKTRIEHQRHLGWVSMAGTVGPHKRERWVHMLRNI